MNKLLVAVLSILAVSLLSTNSFAFSASNARGIYAGETAVKVHYRHWYRHSHFHHACHHYRLCHYPYPNWYANDGYCSLLWPF